MPTRSRLSQKEILEIQRLVSLGLADGDIATKLGRHRSSVARVRLNQRSRGKTTSGKMIQVRISEEEDQAFQAEVDRLGLTRSEAGRRLLRNGLGILDIAHEEVAALHELRRELNAVGKNVNQLTALAHSGRLKWNVRDAQLMFRLDERIDEVINQIVALVSAGRQRAFVEASFPLKGLADE